jgi:transposase
VSEGIEKAVAPGGGEPAWDLLPGAAETSGFETSGGAMVGRRRYSDETRVLALRMLAERRYEHGAMTRVARELGVNTSTLRYWISREQAMRS